jgi:hypothetical protein
MNFFEILFVLLGLLLSYRFGTYFVGKIGWWGVLPAGILGFGLVGGLLLAVRKFLRHRDPRAQPK